MGAGFRILHFFRYKHLSLKVPNIEFDINAYIGKSMLGFRH